MTNYHCRQTNAPIIFYATNCYNKTISYFTKNRENSSPDEYNFKRYKSNIRQNDFHIWDTKCHLYLFIQTKYYNKSYLWGVSVSVYINVSKRRRECGTYLATARRHRRRLKMQKRDE